MDHRTARELLRDQKPTWGALRDHMMNRFFDDPDGLPSTSNVNPAISITKVWELYDNVVSARDPTAVIDIDNLRDEAIACNIVRDFGLPLKI